MYTTSVINMAKKQGQSKVGGRERKPMAVQIRGNAEWKKWVEMIADTEHDTVSKFFERLVHQHAKSHGLPEMPDR